MSNNMNVLMNNTVAMFSNRQLGITGNSKAKSTEKLSSGYKINRAADDAAGLTISEKLRSQIRGLNQGAKNVQDGVSFVQTADGYLNEVSDMLQRMNELSIKAANGTNSDEDREAIDSEIRELKKETNRIFKTAEFNTIKIFNVPYTPDVEVSTKTKTELTTINTTLPPGVTMDSNTLANGYFSADPYTKNSITYSSAATFDFSNVDMSDLSRLDGTGFNQTCCTCNSRNVCICFDSSASESKSEGTNYKTYTIGIKDCSTPSDIVERIVAATASEDHFTNYEADIRDPSGSTLVIYDNRPDQRPNPDHGYGMVFPGVTEERTLTPIKDDIQVFNIGFDSKGDVLYGGVELNHVRHTWDELGINVSADGKTFMQDQTITFPEDTDYTGERVVLKVSAGSEVPDVVRNYTWSVGTDANGNEGICVNNVFAATWKDMGIKESGNSGEYSFVFRGMLVSFTVEDGDSLQDIKDGLTKVKSNVDDYSWDLSIGDYLKSQAVDITDGSSVRVTNSNKAEMDKNYYIIADTNGITISTDPGMRSGGFTSMAWEQFVNRGTDLPNDYPVSDWGINDKDSKSLNSDLITLDDESVYHYENNARSDMKISFDYTLKDETSLNAAISALNGVKFTNYVNAPGNITTSSVSGQVNVNPASVTATANNMDFALQRAYGRDFDDPSATLSGSITRSLSYDFSDPNTPLKDKTVYNDPEIKNQTIVSTTQGNEIYILEDDGYYYKYTRDVTTVARDFSQTDTDYEYASANYKYNGSFAGETMNEITGTDFTLVKTTDKETTWTDTVEVYSNYQKASSPGLTRYELDLRNEPYLIPDEKDEKTISSTGYIRQPDVVKVYSDSKGTLYDNVKIVTNSGNPMELRVSNNLGGIDISNLDSTFSSNITFTATGYADREFLASPNIYNNVNEEGIYSEVTINSQGKNLWIQSGGQRDDGINLHWEGMNNSTLGIAGVSVATQQSALRSIEAVKRAINKVSAERSQFGAYQNRLEHTYNNDLNIAENTQAAESRIRDTDMASEMMRNAKLNILEQAGQSVLAQANQQRQGILSLLQ